MKKIVINGVEVSEVRGIAIEELYKVYKQAVKEVAVYWENNCLVDCDTDYKPLEAFLCISRDKDDCWYYRDLPYSWETGWSEKMYYATRINLLAEKVTAITDNFEGDPYEYGGDPCEWATEEDLEIWYAWREEYREEQANNLDFRSFKDIVEDLIEG